MYVYLLLMEGNQLGRPSRISFRTTSQTGISLVHLSKSRSFVVKQSNTCTQEIIRHNFLLLLKTSARIRNQIGGVIPLLGRRVGQECSGCADRGEDSGDEESGGRVPREG